MMQRTQFKQLFSSKVVEHRTKLGMSQLELAGQMDISVGRIQMIEAGVALPNLLLALQLIAFLGIDANVLIRKLEQAYQEGYELVLPDNVIPFPSGNRRLRTWGRN